MQRELLTLSVEPCQERGDFLWYRWSSSVAGTYRATLEIHSTLSQAGSFSGSPTLSLSNYNEGQNASSCTLPPTGNLSWLVEKHITEILRDTEYSACNTSTHDVVLIEWSMSAFEEKIFRIGYFTGGTNDQALPDEYFTFRVCKKKSPNGRT